MAEIRYISKGEGPPKDVDCVLIEKAGNRFVANGSVAGKRDATFFTPPPFPTVEAAVDAAKAWAEAHGVPIVYVRDIPHATRS
jgi:nicotinamidase-related amidase